LTLRRGAVGISDEKENMRRRLLRCCFLPCIDMRDSGGHDVMLYICLGKDVLMKDGRGFRKRKREGRGVFELLEGGQSSASTARKYDSLR
jgi:hypothetical protein